MAHTDPATPKQQRHLRTLAQKTGTSFTPPQTKAQASREIKRLEQLGASPRHEQRQDRKAIADGFERRGGDSAVRPDEIDGWGSQARWK